MKIRRLKNNVNEKKFANGLEVYDVQNDLSSYLFICFFFFVFSFIRLRFKYLKFEMYLMYIKFDSDKKCVINIEFKV